MDLREVRFKKRLTQWQLSNLSEVQQSRISLMETGQYTPKEDEKIKLCKALKVNPEDVDWSN